MTYNTESVDKLRDVIAGSFQEPILVGTFIVIAEVASETGETEILTWHDGGTVWQKIGMASWFKKQMYENDMEDTGR